MGRFIKTYEKFNVAEFVNYDGKNAKILSKTDDGKYNLVVYPDFNKVNDVDEKELSTKKSCTGNCDREIVKLDNGSRAIYCKGCDRVVRNFN